MKRLFAAALAAFFVSAVPAFADDEDQGKCWPRDEAFSTISEKVEQAHGLFQQFAHEKAESFLDVVNKTGDPTDYHADEIFVIFLPSMQMAYIHLVQNGCTTTWDISISPDVLMKALQAAHLVGV